jgi:hypothetical protein
MTTFTPPTAPDTPRGDPNAASLPDLLFRYYAPQEAGETVWKDTQGEWHSNVYPYQGGNSYRVFHDGILITETFDDPDTAIATAEVVFLGGHTYDITEDMAAELTAAGFGDRISIGPVKINHWEQSDADKLSRFIMSADAPNVTGDPTIDSNERVEFRLVADDGDSISQLREFWLHSDITGTDFSATTILDPAEYGPDIEPGIDVLPQSGIALRVQDSGGIHTGITINNNIFFVVPFINVGVWRANSDGSGFTNRQKSMPIESFLEFPFAVDIELEGVICRVRNYRPWESPPSWDDPIHAMTVNLDTDAGDSVAIPTPVGDGAAGVIVAHLGGYFSSVVRFGPTQIRRKNGS